MLFSNRKVTIPSLVRYSSLVWSLALPASVKWGFPSSSIAIFSAG